jgi:outer membrane PBP1 activator LpoA protein
MPDTTWGKRLNNAFKERYERLGGSVYAETQYPSKSNDYGHAIKDLLNLTQSKSRHSIIQTIIRENAEFQPRRRKDIDMIFIGANARQARIIKPQLKFHYAQDIQVYATSHIANSNAKKSADRDRDLNGVYYVDMPWTLKSKDISETNDIVKHWPTLNKTHGRLFAMGIDAYRLIPQLKRLKLNPDESYQGLTGILTVDNQGRIHRKLLLATYKKGKQVEITDEISD